MKIDRRQSLQLLAAPAVGAAVFGRSARARAATTTVRIGYQKWGLLLVLKSRGALEKALGPNVSVEWSEFPGGIQLVEALQAGKLDLGVLGEGPPIFAQASGAPIVYLGAEPPAPKGEAIIVPKDSPLQSVADLRGRQVVLNKGANVHYLLIKALEEAKVAYSDLKITFVPPAGARAAFESGKVDAWVIWDPFLASVQHATGARVLRDAQGLAQNPGYYVGIRSFADSHPALVQAFLAEVKTTGGWVNGHRAEVAKLLAPSVGIEEAALRTSLERGAFGVRPIDDALIASQQKVADTFLREGLIPRAIKIAEARWTSPAASAGFVKAAQR